MKICTSEQINCVTFFYTKSETPAHSRILKVDVFPIAGSNSLKNKQHSIVDNLTIDFQTILVQIYICQPQELDLDNWFMILN